MGTVKEKTKEYWKHADDILSAKVSQKKYKLAEIDERLEKARELFRGRNVDDLPVHWQKMYYKLKKGAAALKGEIQQLEAVPKNNGS